MENNENNQNKNCKVEDKKPCHCKKIECLVKLLTLIFALTAMCYSIIVNHKLNVLFKAIQLDPQQQAQQAKDDFLISKKYDKGQSMEKALKKDKPVLAFFYVDWCGYCKKFAPIFHDLSKDSKIKDAFGIAFVNCEDPKNQELVGKFEIQGFPSVFVIKGEDKTQVSNDKLFDNIEALKTELLEKAK